LLINNTKENETKQIKLIGQPVKNNENDRQMLFYSGLLFRNAEEEMMSHFIDHDSVVNLFL
jgi:hypothetical protein